MLVLIAYVAIRFNTSYIAAALCFVRAIFSNVWQLMHSINGRFWSALPGMLMNQSVFVSCAARSRVLRNMRSMLAAPCAGTSTVVVPSNSKPMARTCRA